MVNKFSIPKKLSSLLEKNQEKNTKRSLNIK